MKPGDLELRSPLPGESLDGFVADIVGANDLHKVQAISGAGGVDNAQRPNLSTMRWNQLPALARLLEVDVRELQHRSYPLLDADSGRRAFFGTTIHRMDLRLRERFYAPAALATSAHHRAMWQLKLPFDLVTGELLVSTCPRTSFCGKVQRWRHSAGVGFCDSCVQDLSRQVVPRIEGNLLEAYALAAGLTHTDPALRATSLELLPGKIRAIGADMAYELLLRLVPAAVPTCRWDVGSRLWANDPFELAKGIAGAWDILVGWPQAMTDRLDRDIATSERRHGDGNSGATARFLNLRNTTHFPQPVADIIRRFHETIDTAGPNGDAIRAATMTSLEVAKVLGMGTALVVDLRRRGGFRTVGTARGPVLVPAFDRVEVHRVKRDMTFRWDLNWCNDKLGIPYYAVEQLAAQGRLPLMPHPFFEKRYRRPQTTEQAFDALQSSLADDRPRTIDGARPILDLMHMVGGRLKPWDAVIDAMLEERLDYAVADGTAPIFQRISVRRAELIPHLRHRLARHGGASSLAGRTDPDFPFDGQMSKRDAAEVLNLAPRQATALLKAYPTTPEPFIPVAHVESLARQFVTNTEIGAVLGVPHQTVRAAAAEIGLDRFCEGGFERVEEPRLIRATMDVAKRRKLAISPADLGQLWSGSTVGPS